MRLSALCLGILFAFNAAAAGKPQQPKPAPPARPPLEIKGLLPGTPFDAAVAKFPGAQCHTGSTYHTCMIETTLAETHVVFNVGEKNGAVDDVYLSRFDGNNFAEVVDAFRSKYGQPDRTELFVRKNGLGNHFTTDVYIWTFPEGDLIVAEFNETGSIDPSHPRIQMKSAARLAAERAAATKAAADL